jgi:hypothetical protein
MPERETINRAKEDLREGKSPSTAAGEFVREKSNTSAKESEDQRNNGRLP